MKKKIAIITNVPSPYRVDFFYYLQTHYEDYEEAITEETKALLKVHTSNYRIVGFTESVGIDELVPIAKEHEIPVVEDLGSGVLIDLEKYGLTHEPTVQESIAHGADVVCFSGDKLLGGPQAGIIIGKKKYIDMMKKNQLTRALRIDKFTAAALEMVLMEYLSEETAVQNIPVLRMIATPLEEIEKEARSFVRILRHTGMDAKIQMVSCESAKWHECCRDGREDASSGDPDHSENDQ